MNNYLKGLKRRSTIILLYGQLFIIMFQLATLDQKKVIVCSPYQHLLVCEEQ
jgi:hypothetical protein